MYWVFRATKSGMVEYYHCRAALCFAEVWQLIYINYNVAPEMYRSL